ncbi:MAG: hypothetical protein IPI39_11530 [Candidatus Obscuribacter sp.]|nr:hypothetical protein [Candidatus Obscuribacter sp.]
MNQEPKSSKNPLVKLFELIIKGVMGFFMVFYLLWKNTAEPLHKEAYEGRPFGQFIGRVLAFVAFVWLCYVLIPLVGVWSFALAYLGAALTYSHMYPVCYVAILRPLYRLLVRFSKQIKALVEGIVRLAKRAVKFVWRKFKWLFTWIGRNLKALWLWFWRGVERALEKAWPYLRRFGIWLANIIDRLWPWIERGIKRLVHAVWPRIVQFSNWLGDIFERYVWPHLVSLLRWLDLQLESAWLFAKRIFVKLWPAVLRWFAAFSQIVSRAAHDARLWASALIGPLMERIKQWSAGFGGEIMEMIRSINTWSIEMWQSLSQLYERLAAGSKK